MVVSYKFEDMDHFLQLSACAAPSALSTLADRDILLQWARFLSGSHLDTLAKDDPIMTLAKDTLDQLSADPEVARAAREREDALHLYRMDLHAARNEGRAEGHQEGHAEGRQEGRQEGHAEGRQEAAGNMLRALVLRRFGAIPETLEARIHRSTIEELQRLLLESADAPSLEVALQRAGWHDSSR